jgi:sodium/hydrogen antiporter
MLLLVFAVTLLVAVLISCKAKESILSVSVLFLIAGLLLGEGLLGARPPNRDFLYILAEVALFSVLFTDGMKTGGVKKISTHWHMAGRALVIGMPLTIGGIAILAHWLVGLNWTGSLLLGSVLSPTDPIFASALFQFEAIPQRIKQVLNLESGLNDGLALPAVLVTLDAVAHQSEGFIKIGEEMLLGLAIGVAIPWIGIKLEQSRLFGATGLFQRLNAFAIGLLVLAVSLATSANLFLAAFAAGITAASVNKGVTEAFEEFGELITELLKLSALLIFGARVAPIVFSAMPVTEYIFAALALFLVRPAAMELSYLGTGLPQAEVLTIGWFGPKGFSSVVYALLVLQTQTTVAEHVARISALVIAASITIYSSTDILIGRWYEQRHEKGKPSEKRAA